MAKRSRQFSVEEDDMGSTFDSFSLASVLMLLTRGHGAAANDSHVDVSATTTGEVHQGKMFECKTCSRKFTTFQALGGHRASHKKPKQSGSAASGDSPEKPKVHECSVCGLEFAIGQALGGHMRRHRVTAEGTGPSHSVRPTATEAKRSVEFDLNLPPLDQPEEEERLLPRLLGFTLTPAAAMVDCFQ